MHKVIISLFFIGIFISANDCYIIKENAIGTINSDLLDYMIDQEKQKEALEIKTAVLIEKGTKACDTDRSELNMYKKQILLYNNEAYWIKSTTSVEYFR